MSEPSTTLQYFAPAGRTRGLYAGLAAMKGSTRVAALSLYENPAILHHGMPVMLFGDLDLDPEHPEAIRALFGMATQESLAAGRQAIIGPVNGSTWGEYRLPLDGELPLFSGDLTAPSSWCLHLQEAGFRPADNYISTVDTIMDAVDMLQPEEVHIRAITPASLTADLELIYPLCMQAFAAAPYFSPVAKDIFIAQYEQARPLVGAGLSYIAVRDGEAVAFILGYPDLLLPERKAVVIKTIARHPGRRYPGLVRALTDHLYRAAHDLGYRQAIHAFMHEDNRSRLRSERLGSVVLRRYAVFLRELHDAR